MELSEGLIGNAVVLVALVLFGWRAVTHLDAKIDRLGEQIDDVRDRVSRIEGSLNPAKLSPPRADDT